MGPCVAMDGGLAADVDAAPSDAQGRDDAASDAASLDPDASSDWWGGALPEPYLCGQPGVSAKAELHLGHTDRIRTLKRSARRVLSQDAQGRWLLWDSDTRRPLVEGTAREDSEQKPGSRVDLAGNVFAIPVIAGVELRELETGATRVVVPTTDTFGLAQDGSYLWASSALGVTVWNAAGGQLFSRPGNYATAQIYAAPTELRIAKGPAGAQVIERIATLAGSDSTPTVSLPFVGEFLAWFDDGERFVTREDATVRVYAQQAVLEQRRIAELPSGSVGGHGNYLWTFINDQGPLCAYPVQGEEPRYCVQAPAGSAAEGFFGGVLLRYGERTAFSADGLELTGEKPGALSFALPATFTTLAADGSGRWVLGDNDGALALGDALSKSASFARLGCGRVLALAGGGSELAMATADGVLRLFSVEADVMTLRASYPLRSTALALSADGSLLAAGKTLAEQNYYYGEQSLRLVALPAATLQQIYPQQMSAQSGGLFEFALAASGTRLARVACTAAAAAGSCRLLVGDPRGLTTTLDLTFNVAIESESPPIRVALGLSPDGRHVALSYAAPGSDWLHGKTWVYSDGQLAGTIDGVHAGFASDGHLVITSAKESPPRYTSALTTLQGVQVAPLGESLLRGASAVDATHFFIASENTLYTLADGQQAWSGARLGGELQRGTTLAGARIVYTTDHRIALYTWQ